MKRVQGNPDVALLECTNPVRNKWRVRWDVTADDSGAASYMEEEFNHKPSGEEIKSLISGSMPGPTSAFCPASFTTARLYGCPPRTSSTIRQLTTLRSRLPAPLCR